MAAVQALHEGWADSPSALIAELDRAAKGCVEIAPRNNLCHTYAGWAAVFTGERERMVASQRRALDLVDLPAVHGGLARVLAIAGNTEEALEHIAVATEVSPVDRSVPEWLRHKALALFVAERYKDSRAAAFESLEHNANTWLNREADLYQILAASHAQLEEFDEAGNALAKAKELRPNLSIELVKLRLAAADHDYRENYLEGLCLAGLED